MCDREMKECVGCEYILMGGRTLGVGVPGRAWAWVRKIKKICGVYVTKFIFAVTKTYEIFLQFNSLYQL